MIERRTAYRLCGIWGIGLFCQISLLIGLLILAQHGDFLPGSWIRFYLEGFLVYFMIGIVMFGTLARRPDIAEDLEKG